MRNIFIKKHKALPIVEKLDDNLAVKIESKEKEAIASYNQLNQGSDFKKGFSGKKISYATPISILGAVDMVGNKFYQSKNSQGNYRDLNQLLSAYSKKSVVNSIINLRANQVAAFGTPSRYTLDGVGFEVVLKEKENKPNPTQTKEIKNIEEFLHYTSEDRSTGINFRTWLKQTVRDVLTYDQANTELVYKRNSRTQLMSFYAVDAGSVYYVVDANGNRPTGKTEDKYIQKIGDDKAVYYKEGELTFDVMNPRTDIYAYQYGLSPLEVVLNQVSYHSMTEEFNNKYFTQGGTTNGLLLINPGENNPMTQQAMEDFRRDWSARFMGANGAWKTPVVNAQDAKFINMNQSSKDMEFEKWINYLINIITSNFGVDPAEIGFPNRGGATGSKGNSLQESSKSELSELSKDKGLSPLLDFIEDLVNDNIVSKFGEGEYLFRFTGNELQHEIQMLNKVVTEVTNTSYLDEGRALLGKDPLPDKKGEVILNQHWVNYSGQLQSQKNADRAFNYQKAQDKKADKKEENANPANSEVPADVQQTDNSIMQNGQPRETQSSKQRNKK